eukprot:GDKI01039634.1.p1 GENE.GDKI01039634.1~~GDKI01039634.1.p1  ORF type:complete len:162 (-),score=25.85 GDKI01039634.1:171-656(-)
MLSLYINNKHGSLVFQKDFGAGSEVYRNLSSNDRIVLASTFHSLSAIAQQISPVQMGGTNSKVTGLQGALLQASNSCGINVMEADSFKMQCFQTLTGMKFIAVLQPGAPDVEPFLRGCYEAYSDYVLKNPFYDTDMPIRIETFDQEVSKLHALHSRSFGNL